MKNSGTQKQTEGFLTDVRFGFFMPQQAGSDNNENYSHLQW
jgi:hypothetical protein